MSLPGFTWQCGLNFFRSVLQNVIKKGLFLTKEKNIRGGVSGVMGNINVEIGEKRKIVHIDVKSLYG